MICRCRWRISRCRLSRISTRGRRGEDRLSGVRDLGDEAVGVVGGVGGGLDPAVGQGDGEGASHVAAGVLGLTLLEVGVAVVVGDAVLVGVRLWRQLFLWGAVGGGASGDCQADGQEGGNTE